MVKFTMIETFRDRIEFIKLLREATGFRLADAKKIADKLLSFDYNAALHYVVGNAVVVTLNETHMADICLVSLRNGNRRWNDFKIGSYCAIEVADGMPQVLDLTR